mgnify:CR=1 FL=1
MEEDRITTYFGEVRGEASYEKFTLTVQGSKLPHVRIEHFYGDHTDYGTTVWEGDLQEEDEMHTLTRTVPAIRRTTTLHTYAWLEDDKPLTLVFSEVRKGLVLKQVGKVRADLQKKE